MISFILNQFILPVELEENKIKTWIDNCVQEEKKTIGEINYEFLSDQELLKINIEYLNHDAFTDIITFNNSVNPEIISTDIFISHERIKENYTKHETTFELETLRVIIHGILHLCYYNDKTIKEKELMREKENYYLAKYFADASRETKINV